MPAWLLLAALLAPIALAAEPGAAHVLAAETSITPTASTVERFPWNTKFDPYSNGLFVRSPVTFIIPSTHRNFTGYLAIVENPSFFTYALPPQGCGFKANTSTTARQHSCQFATNGGFFDVDTGACLGNIIVNSTVVQAVSTARVNFGMTVSKDYITGYMTQKDVSANAFGATQLLSGAGWLLKDGKSYIQTSAALEGLASTFVTEKAPRTSIGYFPNGTLAIFEVDGEEDIGAGVDLYELVEILGLIGLSNAINLDGGGSSAVFYNGEIIDSPTCNDTPVICERPVTSITCVLDDGRV